MSGSPLAVLVSGVAGTGKSTLGRALARALGWDYIEGDDLHAAESVAKMASGVALSDRDRAPWLAKIRALIDDRVAAGDPFVVTCSALKRRYRELLGVPRPEVLWVHLTAPRAVLAARMSGRRGHYMPTSLLESQLADLEPPARDEGALVIDTTQPPYVIVPRIVDRVRGDASA